MIDTTGQKNTTMEASVLICDEEKFSVDNIDNTKLYLLLLSSKQKSIIEVIHGGQEDCLEIELET